MKNIFALLMATVLSFGVSLPFGVYAMSKKDAVKMCLSEQGIKRNFAKACKNSGWAGDECKALKKLLKPCVRNKVMNG